MIVRESFAAYQARRGVNWSTLREMRESALHYKYRLDNPPETTPVMAFGSAAHCAVLEPDNFPRRYVFWDGGRRYGKAWDEFVAVNAPRTPLPAADYERCLALRDAVRSHPAARKLLAETETELTVTWIDEATRIRCKARIDAVCLASGVLIDFKTTRSTEPRLFGQHAVRLGYLHQLAFYRAGLLANGVPDGEAYLLAAEADGPHDVLVAGVDDDAMYAAGCDVELLLAEVKLHRKRRRWPGRSEHIEALQVPAWFYSSDDADYADELIISGIAADKQ